VGAFGCGEFERQLYCEICVRVHKAYSECVKDSKFGVLT
jgi:hypothetical protein